MPKLIVRPLLRDRCSYCEWYSWICVWCERALTKQTRQRIRAEKEKRRQARLAECARRKAAFKEARRKRLADKKKQAMKDRL